MADDFWFAEADQRVLTALLPVHRPRDSGGGPRAGRSLFARSGCVHCHGSRGEGTDRGPSLRASGLSLEVDQLSARLTGKASKMYRRARHSRILWPLLAKPDIEDLVTYLNSSEKAEE
jgi:mono/diheme cytochrome c family protein